MKIRTISRTEESYGRKSTLDITKVHRNRDPSLHPFDRAREYTKALVATKLDKVFAKPFVGALDGHQDGVHCTQTIRNRNVPLISGSCDGEIRVWDLAQRSCLWACNAHKGFVRGLAADNSGRTFYSCGDDNTVKQWQLEASSSSISSSSVKPLRVMTSSSSLSSIDHHWVDDQFVTSGDVVSIWDSSRSEVVQSYKWGADSMLSVRFNPAEASLLAATSTDRAIYLYDLRATVPMKKVILSMKSNKVAWNPMEPVNFVVANEDHCLYSFDMRNLSRAVMVHKDHVSAVMDIAFSPSGREFVSGSYDRTVRIFNVKDGRSREMYHTKRMQRVFSVAFSVDARYVLSGSDDTNIRIWKAQSSKSVGVVAGRQQRKLEINEIIKKRYQHMPEIKRISRDKPIPKAIKKASVLRHVQADSDRRKRENRKRHSASTETEDTVPERKRVVVKEII